MNELVLYVNSLSSRTHTNTAPESHSRFPSSSNMLWSPSTQFQIDRIGYRSHSQRKFEYSDTMWNCVSSSLGFRDIDLCRSSDSQRLSQCCAVLQFAYGKVERCGQSIVEWFEGGWTYPASQESGNDIDITWFSVVRGIAKTIDFESKTYTACQLWFGISKTNGGQCYHTVQVRHIDSWSLETDTSRILKFISLNSSGTGMSWSGSLGADWRR